MGTSSTWSSSQEFGSAWRTLGRWGAAGSSRHHLADPERPPTGTSRNVLRLQAVQLAAQVAQHNASDMVDVSLPGMPLQPASTAHRDGEGQSHQRGQLAERVRGYAGQLRAGEVQIRQRGELAEH